MKQAPPRAPRVRDFVKHVLVSPEVHTRLREYAKECGYKTQYIADQALEEYLERQEKKKP